MSMGLAYDSAEGRALCGALTAMMTGVAYATSAEIAGEAGPFPGYAGNADHMLRVIRNHRRAAHGAADGYEGLAVKPVPLDHAACPDKRLAELAKAAWDEALRLGEAHGFRNAQVTVIAPTGTIGLVMDCDTTGIEPDFALVKFKKLAGGGYFKIINRSVPAALNGLAMAPSRSAKSSPMRWVAARSTARRDQPHRAGRARLRPRRDRPDRGGAAGGLRHPFSSSTSGPWALRSAPRSSASPRSKLADPAFDMLAHLGFPGPDRRRQRPCLRGDDAGRRAASAARASGGVRLRQSLRQEGQAAPVGRKPHPHDGGGPELHLGRDLEDHQHANSATIEDCLDAYRLSWSLGVKANALYRDGSKLSQPLAASLVADDDDAEEVLATGAPADKARVLAEKMVEKIVVKEVEKARRDKLPERRRAIPRRPSWAATRSICAPANMRTASLARSSSTCTRKARASAR
jgi:ribonucleoside-diphosphate reductase alpha chain